MKIHGKKVFDQAVALSRKLRAKRGSDGMEQLLIEQILFAWLDLDIAQVKYVAATKASHRHEDGLYWDRRLSSAQHRYLRAVEALGRIRKLSVVAPLQVNIGGQSALVAGWPW